MSVHIPKDYHRTLVWVPITQAQEEKLRKLRAELDDCDHADPPKPEMPLVEGPSMGLHD